MAKRRKKRVKSEPKPPKWLIFKCFNQTKEEVYFGASQTCPKWQGSRYDLRGVPELAHWDLEEDKIMILKIYKRKRYESKEQALTEARYWERSYVHWRNFWVIRTGKNALGPQPERKPVKPPRPPRGYYFNPDLMEDAEDFEFDDVEDDFELNDVEDESEYADESEETGTDTDDEDDSLQSAYGHS